MVKVRTTVATWETLPHATWETLPTPNFVKKMLQGIYPFGVNLYQKNTIFSHFGGCKPAFSKPQT